MIKDKFYIAKFLTTVSGTDCYDMQDCTEQIELLKNTINTINQVVKSSKKTDGEKLEYITFRLEMYDHANL